MPGRQRRRSGHGTRHGHVPEEDLPGLEIEISVLSEFQPLSPQAAIKPDLPEAISNQHSPLSPRPIVAGTHGLLVVRDDHRALLLPQVAAERHWSAERLLEETCEKAGLDRDAWRDPSTNVFVFTADVFSEANARSA